VNNVFPPIFDVNLRYFASEFCVYLFILAVLIIPAYL
jgi:hypothetical protein